MSFPGSKSGPASLGAEATMAPVGTTQRLTTLPRRAYTSRAFCIACSAVVAWTLPAPDTDLAAWIDEQTTARMVGNVLSWPWQKRP